MKAIIIQDTDARALLDKLKLEAMLGPRDQFSSNPPTIEDMHRRFHHVVTRWLQEQGADCVGR